MQENIHRLQLAYSGKYAPITTAATMTNTASASSTVTRPINNPELLDPPAEIENKIVTLDRKLKLFSHAHDLCSTDQESTKCFQFTD